MKYKRLIVNISGRDLEFPGTCKINRAADRLQVLDADGFVVAEYSENHLIGWRFSGIIGIEG